MYMNHSDAGAVFHVAYQNIKIHPQRGIGVSQYVNTRPRLLYSAMRMPTQRKQ